MTTAGLASSSSAANANDAALPHSSSSSPSSSRPPSSERVVVDLVTEAQSGNRTAFASLYDRFHRMVHAVVLSTVKTHEAEDLVQDVFAKALRELGALDDPKRFGGWLQTIARRAAIDLVRSPSRARRASDDELVNVGHHAPPTSEALEALRAIRALPEAYRETLMMRLVEGLTGPEIAELTGMTSESVRVNLCRGMKLLREKLDEVMP